MPQKKRNQTFETIHRVKTFHYRIRIWRAETAKTFGDSLSVGNSIYDKLAKKFDLESCSEVIAKGFANLPRVSAVEVVNRISGYGRLIYNDWP